MAPTHVDFPNPTALSLLLWKAAAAVTLAFLLWPVRASAQLGTPVWTNRYKGPGNSFDSAVAVGVDSNGNAFVTGASTGTGSSLDYATIKYSSGGVPLWTNRYNGPANGDDSATALAVDASGNVIVTGESPGSGSSSDYATIKYSSDGALLWIRRYNGPANNTDSAKAVAVDTNGNVIVTGESYHSGNLPEYATVAYSSAGAPLWTNRYSNGTGNGDDHATALAVDGSGNVFVTGSSQGFFGSGPDYATVAYSNTGIPLWTNRYEGPDSGNGYASAVAVGSTGNVFVTGTSYSNAGADDYATIAYSSAGTLLWTNISGGPNPDQARGLAVDSSGNVIVTGVIGGYTTIKYSGVGVPLWTNNYVGPSGFPADEAWAVGVDSAGNVFVTGRSWDASFTHYDYATVAYSSNGVPLWTQRYNGPGNSSDQAVAMAVDRFGNVYVTGAEYRSGIPNGYATIKYSTVIPPSPIPLNIQIVGNMIVLSWANSAFKLQSAPAVEGPYNDVPGAKSPYSVPIPANQQYFRLQGN